MTFQDLDPTTTAVVFFDMVNAFVRPDAEAEAAHAAEVANAVRLRAAADAVGVPVVLTHADHRPDGSDAAKRYSDTDLWLKPWSDPENEYFGMHTRPLAGSWRSRIIDELEPREHDYVIAKHRWNAFFQTPLELSLRTRGVDTIVLCGGSVPVGIASTAYAARDLDYDLVVVSDCIHSSDDVTMDFFVTRIFPFIARVRTVDEVIAMLGAPGE